MNSEHFGSCKVLKNGYEAGFQLPPRSKWQCQMFGSGPHGMVFCPEEGKEPNWFWRWMQYLCFGNKWVYTGDK